MGIPTREDEDTDDIIIKLGKDLGVDVKKEDISTSHRVKSRGKRGNPILVRFVRREKKQELLRKKKTLRDQKKDVYLEEDLTRMRAAIFYELRKDESVHSAWTYDGSLHYKTSPSQAKGIAVNSPDDLFHLGWSEERLGEFFRRLTAGDARKIM